MDAAVEAAAKALEGHWVSVGFRDEAGDDASESGTLDLDERRAVAREAVEAAAPILQAAALRGAADLLAPPDPCVETPPCAICAPGRMLSERADQVERGERS